jgi:hypothetical protein
MMRIQPSDNNMNAPAAKPVQETGEPKDAARHEAAGEVSLALANITQKALQSCSRQAAVQEAVKAIAERRLETDQAYEIAAENMIVFGI